MELTKGKLMELAKRAEGLRSRMESHRAKYEEKLGRVTGAMVTAGAGFVGGFAKGALQDPTIAGVDAVGGIGAVGVAASLFMGSSSAADHLANLGTGFLTASLAVYGRSHGQEMAGSGFFGDINKRQHVGAGSPRRLTAATAVAGNINDSVQREGVALTPAEIGRASGGK